MVCIAFVIIMAFLQISYYTGLNKGRNECHSSLKKMIKFIEELEKEEQNDEDNL